MPTGQGWGVVRTLVSITLGVLVLTFGACDDRQTEEDANTAASWSLDSAPRVVIGEEQGDEPYLFQGVAAAVIIPDGRITVADRGSSSIRIFEADGTFQQSMGRTGQGPGEFEYIASVVLLPPDTLVVYDAAAFRITRFRTNGALLSTVNVIPESGFPEIYLGQFDDGDFGFAWIVQADRDDAPVTPDVMAFGRFDPDGALVSTFGTTTGMLRYEGGTLPFSPYLHAFVLRDSVYFTDGVHEITVLGQDGSRSISIPVPAVRYDEARRQLENELDAGDRVDALELLADVPIQDSVPSVAEVLLNDEGHLWLKRYQPSTDSNWLGFFGNRAGGEWWILDPNFGHVATIRLHDAFIPRDIRGGQVLGVTHDSLGVERVAVFDIRR